ncbi:hypothetical protein Barb6_01195 [Bacteroidales bacterium Barb6]|nr:hypothetical protein Barb6XT_00367 [Bacteroidales bacterium Barb6XT]OAV72360.1 hypothetical protein Barb6_01195 [Bacteroidales bacterium Barb6]
MNKRKLFIRLLVGLIVLTAAATVVAYFLISPVKPWMAFFIACCGGLLIVNFLVSLFLVNRNYKKK